MFGAQVGQALGKLADEVVTSTDVGLPLGPGGHRRARAAERRRVRRRASTAPPTRCGCSSPCARPPRQRLFAHVPWLRQQLQDAVHAYARGITIDREAIERGLNEAMSGMEGGIDPSNPESIQQLLGSGVLEPEETPGAADGAAPAGDAARAGRGLGGHGRRRGGEGPAARALGAGRDDAPAPGLRRAGRADLRHAGRAGAAAAPAARRRHRVGRHGPAATAAPSATGSGRTPTCCRPRTTSTSRWTSSPGRAWTTSSRR